MTRPQTIKTPLRLRRTGRDGLGTRLGERSFSDAALDRLFLGFGPSPLASSFSFLKLRFGYRSYMAISSFYFVIAIDAMTAVVKVFGCRPVTEVAANSAA